jgi:hypothetical protein
MPNALMIIGGWFALVLEIGILIGIGYGALRLATRYSQMRRDIEELKLAVRELRQRG